MPTYPVPALTAICDLEEAQLRRLRQLLFRRAGEDVQEDELLSVLLYDLLPHLGFNADAVMAVLLHFQPELTEISTVLSQKLEQHDPHLPMVMLQLFDNRYVALCGYGKLAPHKTYDLTASATIQQLPRPMLSLAVILPELLGRAKAALTNSSDPRVLAAARQASKTEPATGP